MENISKGILEAYDKTGIETVRVILESLSDMDLGKLIGELRNSKVNGMSYEDSYRYHTWCARATIYPDKSDEEVKKIIEENLLNDQH